MFNSLKEIKEVAEKFEAGKIVPRRVLNPKGKGNKRIRHKIKFTKNVYRVLGKDNYHIFLIDYNETTQDDGHFIRVSCFMSPNLKIDLQGASHGKSGNQFIGNYNISDDKCLRLFNHAVFGKKKEESR